MICNFCNKPIEPTQNSIHTKNEGNLHMSCYNTVRPPKQQGHDPVNHPQHYTDHPSGIECIQITRHMNFNCGNAVKYLWRAGKKDPTIQDLKKAVWYIQDEIKRLESLPENQLTKEKK